jgi:hypothetical protein
MSSEYIPVTLKQLVFDRARSMCEYCRSQIIKLLDRHVVRRNLAHPAAISQSYHYDIGGWLSEMEALKHNPHLNLAKDGLHLTMLS